MENQNDVKRRVINGWLAYEKLIKEQGEGDQGGSYPLGKTNAMQREHL